MAEALSTQDVVESTPMLPSTGSAILLLVDMLEPMFFEGC
jgi:hypothetical protein